MRQNIYDTFQLDSVNISYENGYYRLIDNESGEDASAKSLSHGLNKLRKKISEYKKRPEIAVEVRRKQAGKLINNMCRDQFLMIAILVGLVSAENNRTESQIKKNLEYFRWLQTGLMYATPKNARQKSNLKTIDEKIRMGIEILERDEIKVPARQQLESVLGRDTLLMMCSLYDSYFDPITVSTNARDRYIHEKFGKCKEPVYDHLWNLWYLGHEDENGNVRYSVGSATDIIGEFLDYRLVAKCSSYTPLKIKSMTMGGTLNDAFRHAWERRSDRDNLVIEDKDLLSPRERILWKKIRAYGKSQLTE